MVTIVFRISHGQNSGHNSLGHHMDKIVVTSVNDLSLSVSFVLTVDLYICTTNVLPMTY